MTTIPAEIQIALVAVFLAVAVVVGLLAVFVVFRQSTAQRRLGSFARQGGGTDIVLPASPLAAGTVDPSLARWSRLLPKSAKDMSALERRLAAGGYRSKTALLAFGVAPLVCSVCAALAALLWFGLLDRTGWMVAALAAAVGYMAPGFYLDYRISQRRREIRNALPDVIDLLIVCLEAGSSLDQSVVKATEELAIAYPAMSEELRVLTTETRAGKPRLEAFKNLAQRTKIDDVRALVGMLVQTDRFGTSISQALRAMAEDMRTRRRQAAEERAGKVGVKLVFPLVFCMFPALFVVILGPVFLQFVRVFSRQVR